MTKTQNREVNNIRLHLVMGNPDAAARGLSALIRAALRAQDRLELRALAIELRLADHPEFIA